MAKMLCSSITLQLPELHIHFHWHLAHPQSEGKCVTSTTMETA